MLQDRLSGLALIHIEKELCELITEEEVIDQFASIKDRKMDFFLIFFNFFLYIFNKNL